MLWIAVLAVALAALLYWELVVAEGAHLGPRVVVWLYDQVAHRYDRIKKYDPEFEDGYLGLPLAEALVTAEAPRVLDVAAGTGRLARALLRQPHFDGAVFSADLSAKMIVHGRRTTGPWGHRAAWLRGPAGRLPFASGTFEAVACLEALEFLPDPPAALAECVRVLRPGGLLLVTNRVGADARLLLGKTYSRAGFLALLGALPLETVRVHPWQVDYDLGWARKSADT